MSEQKAEAAVSDNKFPATQEMIDDGEFLSITLDEYITKRVFQSTDNEDIYDVLLDIVKHAIKIENLKLDYEILCGDGKNDERTES